MNFWGIWFTMCLPFLIIILVWWLEYDESEKHRHPTRRK
jgi:low temperature requirement protein LtrA